MDNDQNARYFRVDGQLRYHWSADQEIMTIINKRDKSPETSELVTKQIELANPGSNEAALEQKPEQKILRTQTTGGKRKKRDQTDRPQIQKKRENHTLAAVISETLATKYHKEQNKTKKHSETPNQPPQATPKRRWQHTNTEPTPQYRYRNTATAQSRK